MFWPDVIALKEFYATPLGRVACLAVGRRIRRLWPQGKGETILGLGFATPYLSAFAQEAQSIFACMPAGQGVIHWPPSARNLSLLSDEAELPFPDNSMNRVLVIHALENSEQVRQMMSEVWRVLSPAGRVIAIVPNRRGIWARSPGSPFAYGQPYTSGQFRRLLSEHSFTPLHSTAALFFPPSTRRYVLRSARFWESIGSQFFSGFGGVLLIEAEKQIYAPLMQKVRDRSRRAYAPLAQPAGI
jgi:SAM-dependent methyltransferase